MMQVYIAATTVLALALISRSSVDRRWGFVVGLAGQPGWLYVTWSADQWGMLVVALMCTALYAIGVYQHFLEAPLARAFEFFRGDRL
jgi:hypothetical protein